MKKRITGIFLVMLFLLIINVSAGIYFTQPEPYYNLGDVLEIGVEVEPLLEGFLKVDLVCDGGIINIFNGIPGDNGVVNIKFPLTFSYIQENSGKCYFLGEYSQEIQQSNSFEISKALNVELDTESLFANPGENITITGTAKRLNGAGVNGNVDVAIPLLKLIDSGANEEAAEEETEEEITDNNTEEGAEEETPKDVPEKEINVNSENGVFHGKIEEGRFSVNINLKRDIAAGDYRIDVLAYEKDSLGKKTSEGLAMANLKIFQILTGIDIAINSQSIDPGTVLEFKPMMMDQSGQPISEDVSVIITDEDSNRVFQKILQSEETSNYQVPTNLSSGYYQIEASSGELSSMKKFYVNEKAIALFEIRNNSLVITNVGNIPYKKDVQVELNGKPFVKETDLMLGESQEFKLAGDGEYDVKVSDGETEISQAEIVLTGHAVSVESVKKGIVTLNTPIVWIVLIILLGGGILFFFRNVLKKKSFAYPLKDKLKQKLRLKKKTDNVDLSKEKSKEAKAEDIKNKILNPVKLSSVPQAESVLVLKGHRNKVAVICLKIKNQLSKSNKENFERIIKHIETQKGSIYKSGDYVLGIFSPLVTKSFKNEARAAKAAQTIQESLKQNNQKFTDKIEFGISINSGEVINKIEDKKLKFTALGNLIPGAKRLAEASNEQVLLTKEAYLNAGSEIKATQQGDVYEVRRIVDKEKNQEFIKNFLNKVDKEEKEQKPKTSILP